MVISVGDIMLDIYIQEPDSLNPDTDTEGSTKLMWGGSAANFAVWASRLGLDSYINGKVGSDFLGDAAP
ncbi:MAG: carbohydrate kinase family protein [Bacillus subtilis]|nr:carbohydrate kinase family protein [Bacillus subtilis]